MPDHDTRTRWDAWNELRNKVVEKPSAKLPEKLNLVFLDMLEGFLKNIPGLSDLAALIHTGQITTPEQIKAFDNSLKAFDQALKAFEQASAYAQAMKALVPVKSAFPDLSIQTDKREEIASVKQSFVFFYFAIHSEIRVWETKLTQADKKKIVEQFKRFEPFLIKRIGKDAIEQPIKIADFWEAIETFITKEHPADAPGYIQKLNSILPSKHIIPNDKFANELTNIPLDYETTLTLSKAGAIKPIETTVILACENDENIHLTGTRPLTEYDRNVYNAVTSLWVAGVKAIAPSLVHRAMTGKTETEKLTKQQIARVKKSIDKMRLITVKMNLTDALKAWHVTIDNETVTSGEIDTYLLATRRKKLEAGGKIIEGYELFEAPVLYTHARLYNQVLTLPRPLIDVKIVKDGKITTQSLPTTEQRILLTHNLLRRIEGMKGENNLKQRTIALKDYERDGKHHKGLYSIAGKPNANKIEAKRIREDVEKILLFWKAYGYIESYEAVTKNRQIISYKIKLPEQEQDKGQGKEQGQNILPDLDAFDDE